MAVVLDTAMDNNAWRCALSGDAASDAGLNTTEEVCRDAFGDSWVLPAPTATCPEGELLPGLIIAASIAAAELACAGLAFVRSFTLPYCSG